MKWVAKNMKGEEDENTKKRQCYCFIWFCIIINRSVLFIETSSLVRFKVEPSYWDRAPGWTNWINFGLGPKVRCVSPISAGDVVVFSDFKSGQVSSWAVKNSWGGKRSHFHCFSLFAQLYRVIQKENTSTTGSLSLFQFFSLYGVVQIRKFNIVSQISEERPLLFVWSYPNLNSLKMLLGNFPQIIPFFLWRSS